MAKLQSTTECRLLKYAVFPRLGRRRRKQALNTIISKFQLNNITTYRVQLETGIHSFICLLN